MRHNEEYDIVAAFEKIENELIASMIRNMDDHRAEEDKEELLWSQWQVEQLKALELYKVQNQKKYQKQFASLNKRIEELIRVANETGNMEQEIEILQAIKDGFKGYKKASGTMTAKFFKLNEQKLEALIQATMKDMEKAETAILRMANDKYRKAIFNAQVYANTGAGTYEKAVDMATKEMLSAGLNCVEYANGARHTLKDYADMAIRTASKRAYLQGEGTKRQEWGIATVIMNKRGNPCPKCLPFVGKVLIDDVWSGGTSDDGKYPLMSYAISKGLYHPRCRDSHTTYFPGISSADDTWTERELEAIGQNAKIEAKLQYAQRQIERFERLAKYSLDEENQQQYANRADLWRNVRFRTGNVTAREYAANKAATDKATTTKNFIDKTGEWFNKAIPNSHEIEELTEFIVGEVSYSVDGINVKQNKTKREFEVAEMLKKVFGGEIKLVPEINGKYTHIKTPDYLYNGERYDLKELRGESKDAIRNAIHKKKGQAENFIIDITESKLSLDEIYTQAESVFTSFNTEFVKTIIIIKDEQFLKILQRT